MLVRKLVVGWRSSELWNGMRRGNLLFRRLSIATLLIAFTFQSLGQRVENNTITIPVEPIILDGELVLKDAFPGAQFNKPVAIRNAPGETHRVFVAERVGRIMVLDLTNSTPRVFLDIRNHVFASDWINDRRAEGLTSFAFHPDFAENGRFFVTYTTITTTSQGTGHHNRISEFRVRPDGTGDEESEIPLITQFDEGDGHNINDAHFGPDGYLYIASGDEGDGGGGDDFHNAQRIDKDFFSAILRIDVDKRSGNLPPNPHAAIESTNNYAVPVDNPLVGLDRWQGNPIDRTKLRTEFFAVGLRNPWRFSFDPSTGMIYEGDVGQHGREEINIIKKGGNYGWSYLEGELTGPAGTPPAGLELTAPIFKYGTGFGHFEGFSVTAGVVYRGARLPMLYGHLVFADYVSGNIWTMNIDVEGSAPQRILGEVGIAGFGYDPRNGDVLLVNHDRGIIQRLDVSGGSGSYIPTRLSETGIFSDLATLTPHAGIYPYDINLPFWSDGSSKERWFSIPAISNKMVFGAETNWSFPTGAYFIKHFEAETVVGDPSSKKRLETRVLIKKELDAYGITYKWNDEGTEAELVSEYGETRQFAVTNGTSIRQQTWIYPGRQECMACHTTVGGIVLGFNTPQLNRNGGFGATNQNQIEALALSGFLENPPEHYKGLFAYSRLENTNVSRTFRVKSYLAANCSFCHQPEGSARGVWDGRITTPLSAANIINGSLFNDIDSTNKVVVPGDASRSALLKRLQATDQDRMPPVGSTVHDEAAIALLLEWINEDLDGHESYDEWAARIFGSVTAEGANKGDDPDADGLPNMNEYLVSSDPLSAASRLSVEISLTTSTNTNSAVSIKFTQPPNRSLQILGAEDPLGPWEFILPADGKIGFPATPSPQEFLLEAQDPQTFLQFQIREP